ncbi:MAG: SDR family oxidoreductase [Alphaproteobacteria bacterium]|nr:SDR family oxidoreductase [Alphaproteobacteria bacterium]MCB9928575.1 SDR family oxidoreductase [Alphaproteobacteria bacterium]
MSTTGKRVALITGCGKENGIGAATAQRLARDGVIVAVADIAAAGVENDLATDRAPSAWQGLDTLVARIEAAGGEAFSLTGDVSQEASAKSLVDRVVAKYGRLDILVNNAGAPHGKDRGPIEDVPVEGWDAVMNINAKGVFLMTKAAVPHMKRQGWGRIVSMASVAGMVALPERAAYSASKAAVIGLTRSVAHDLAPLGITVNCVCPGSIATDRAISSTLRAGWSDVQAGLAERAQFLPAKRHGAPEEIAALIAYLASEDAGYTTGQAIAVDGGGLPASAF